MAHAVTVCIHADLLVVPRRRITSASGHVLRGRSADTAKAREMVAKSG
jgi:hypothetical protein